MRCLRIYATPDGESHFGQVEGQSLSLITLPDGLDLPSG